MRMLQKQANLSESVRTILSNFEALNFSERSGTTKNHEVLFLFLPFPSFPLKLPPQVTRAVAALNTSYSRMILNKLLVFWE